MDTTLLVAGGGFSLLVATTIAGFFATVIMTLSVMVLRLTMGINMSMPLMLAGMVLPRATDVWKRRIGMAMHLAIGSFFGLLFGLLVQYEFFFSVTVLSGIIYALIPWLVLGLILMPMGGYGFFGMARDRRIALGTLAGHLVYGISLALLLPWIFLS